MRIHPENKQLLKPDAAPLGYSSCISTCVGVLTSPNYPSNYDSDDDCGWLLEVDTNHVVQLTFEDFDVEPHSNCRCLL